MRKTSRRIIPLLALVFLLANADTRVQTATEASEVGRGEDASGGVLVHFDYIEDGQLKGGVVTVPLPMTSLKTGLRIQSRWPATTLVDNGPSDNRIDLVFVGDGYTASELGDYASHVANIIAGFFDEEPFASYASYFNVHRVDVVSRESGVDEPDNGIYRDTALDMEYGCYSNPYLLCIDTDKAWAAASSAADADLVIALANSDRHGGAGYPDLATAGGGNYWAAGLTLHEFGHSQADLADEYYYDGTTYTGSEPSQKNVSVYTAAEQAALQTKWHRWLDHPGVDTYEGAYYHEYDIYRPTSTSKMRSIDQPFGPVNGERLIISFYDSISPIEDATASFPPLLPSDTLFHVTVTQPTSHSLDIQWAIDDVPVPGATDSTFRAPSLSAGIHDVSVTVTDNTDQVRDTSARETRLTAMRQWQIEVSAPAQHALTTSSTGGGIVSSPGEGVFQYDYGTSAPVTATAQPNYHFVTWTGTAVDADKVADAGSAGTTVTMDADYTLQANFAIDQKTLTTSSSAGGSVTTPGEGAYPYDHGSSVAITATAQPNYHFVNWTGTAVDAGKVADAGSASTTVTMDADYTLQANFAIDEKTLTISSTAGGSVTTPGEGAFPYDHGTSAAVTAAPDDNYHFVAWTGTAVDAGKVGDASAASTTVTMDANYTLQANFAIDEKTLTISSTAGGSVTTPGEGAFPYDHGTNTTVTAAPDDSYHFVAWTGTAVDAGKVGDAGSASTTVTIDADYTLQANFTVDLRTLTVSSTAGGVVSTPGEGAFQYDHGTNTTVTAAADDNYHFVAWTGTAVDTGKVADAGSASTTVTIDADYTLQANFALDQKTLTISSTAGGSVTTPGEGAYPYDHGSSAAVQATAQPNYHFVTWTGTAADAGKVGDAGSASTTVTMDVDYTLQANFAIDQKTLAISSTAGGSVTMPGEGAFPYDHGTSAAVTAAPDDNYHFVAWTGTAVDAGKVGDAGSASTAVTVDADYTLEALFAIDQRALSLSSSVGGNVSMPGEGSFLYDHGTVVSVEAVAGANHMFLQWSGTAVEAGQISDPYSATTTIAMDSDCTLRANFTTALARVYVDDDSPEDPRPYDPSLSDPHEDGSAEHPFDEIQEAISVCRDGMYVIILEGVYHECIDSTGLNIVVTSTDPDDPSVVENTIIDGNGSGPVVRLASGEDPNCVLTGLTLTGGNNQRGGGIYCENSSPTIVKCVLTGNQAHYGGGLYTFQSSPTVTNCVFAGNLAAFRGGAVYDRESATVLMNCTLTGNIALDGGGICSTGSDLQLVNCIAWGNLANTGTDETAQVKVDGGALSVEYCCIAGWTGVLGGAGNFDADPCFADAGYWDDHSTPDDADDDSWVNGDYHLKSEAGRWDPNSGSWALDTVTSLCIDAGDPNSDWTAELWPHGKRVNMGAYGGTTQASMSLSNVGNISDYNNDGRVDGNDLRIFARRWLYGAECLAEDSNRDGIVDFFDYTDLAHSWQWKE